MKCFKCGKNEATTQYTKIVNGVKSQTFLCSECAGLVEEKEFNFGFENDLNNFFSGFFGTLPQAQPKKKEDVCPFCNMSFSDFLKDSRLGCAVCYETFSEKLAGPFKQIHGSSFHTGKVPERAGKEIKNTRKLKKLEDELSVCIEKQEFEKAAELRDKIKELKESM